MPRDQEVRATPRNSALGALADFIAQSYSPERTQQMQGVAKFLDMPSISETLDRLSYDPSGRSLFTGAGGLGGTTRFRPEVLDAAIAVAPGAGALGKLAAQGTMAAGRAGARLADRAVPRIMDRGGMGAEMLQGMSKNTVSPMDVYHGSPHKFDRFNASKIGTGEGAQAYGHGLYTAENKFIGSGYREKLAKNEVLLDGAKVKHNWDATDPQSLALNALTSEPSATGASKALRDAVSDPSLWGKPGAYSDDGLAKQYIAAADWLDANAKRLDVNSGYLYKVDLPDKKIARMLDWDKPLSEQPEFVRNTLINDMGVDDNWATVAGDSSGGALYNSMVKEYGSPEAVSAALMNQGIPGIKYLDASSRGAGTGTRNFVTFPGEEQSLTILERNGQPIIGGAIPGRDVITPQSKKELKSLADSFAEQIRALGFDAKVEHSGSKAGASSYINVSDSKTGRFLTKPIRISDHSKGPFESQNVIDILNPEDDFPKVFEELNKMRAMGESLVFKQQKYAQSLIDDGVKPKVAYQRAKDEVKETLTSTLYQAGGAVHMGIGGLLKLKNAVKGAQKVLPAAERDANLAKFLDTSQEKRRLYHATPSDFQEFQGKGFDPTISGNATWLTSNKDKQPAAHNIGSRTQVYREGVNVMPVHVQAERPLVLDNQTMEDWARAVYADDSPQFPFLIAPDTIKKMKEDGYDSIFHPRSGEVIMLDPKKIKSATGNRGTYDTSDPDISKARGGAVHMDEGGAAFGVFPQMKPRRALQDREAAANAPLSALRGWAAGTAGLAGDIEGLARAGISQLPPQLLTAFPALRAFGIGSRADPTPQLPTTEFYNEYLPGAQLNATPTGKAFTTAGNLFGGAGSTTLARYGIKSAKATGQALGPTAVRIGENYLQRQGLMPGVIKMPGGNVLKGELPEALKPLKNYRADEASYMKFVKAQNELGDGYRNWIQNKVEQDPTFSNVPAIDAANMFLRENKQPLLPLDPLNNFINKKIEPYIRDEMATPDDPLRAMAEKYAVDKPAKLAEVQGRIDNFAAKMEQTARERGVPVGDLTSMRQQMIGLEKEKALVEAREGLHFTPDDTNFISHYYANRDKAGTDLKGMGQSPLARSWEDVSDSALNIETAGDILRFKDSFAPWLSKVPPETKVYRPKSNIIERTGFDHLVDELRNAINPASGLPKNLLIDPADLGKLTMPQAVDRVADINAWRATQKAEANQLIANNAATQLVKEYPGQGVKWVELKTSEVDDAILSKLTESERSFYNRYLEGGDTPNEALKGAIGDKDPRIAALKDALKYEGDTMRHCVGGYCPDVIEGRSRIYSLRDDKGQPRVTIEVKPHEGWFTKADRMPDPSGKNRSFHQLIDNERSELARQKGGFGYIGESYEDIANRLASQYQLEAKPNISQIKGFKNKKPADEYLPFVQDFIKSDNWSDVGDLKNSGMIDIQKSSVPWPENTTGRQVDALLGGGINGTKTPKYKSSDFYKLAEQDLGSRYVTEQDYQGWLTKQLDLITPTEGMAHGGLVSTHFDPIKIQQIIARMDDDFDPERIQQIVAQRESAYA